MDEEKKTTCIEAHSQPDLAEAEMLYRDRDVTENKNYHSVLCSQYNRSTEDVKLQ